MCWFWDAVNCVLCFVSSSSVVHPAGSALMEMQPGWAESKATRPIRSCLQPRLVWGNATRLDCNADSAEPLWSGRKFYFFPTWYYCPPDKVLVIAGTAWSSAFTENDSVFRHGTFLREVVGDCLELLLRFHRTVQVPPPQIYKKDRGVICLITTGVRWVRFQRRIHSARK